MAKPKLIVFDLDYTLWPFWLDTHVTPPFHKESNGRIYDQRRHEVKVYPDVPEMLEKLHKEGYQMGLASRTTEVLPGKQLVHLLGWDKYFKYKEIYPGAKTAHFIEHHANSGIPYKNMLFFDDEERNVFDVSKLGVTCILADNGMSFKVLQEGLLEFARKNAAA